MPSTFGSAKSLERDGSPCFDEIIFLASDDSRYLYLRRKCRLYWSSLTNDIVRLSVASGCADLILRGLSSNVVVCSLILWLMSLLGE